MLEVLINIESDIGGAGRLSPIVLIGPSAAAVLLGLLVWLGGLALKRYLLAVVGALTGALCSFFVIGRNVPAAAALAGAAAVIAVIFERLSIAILLALLAAVVAFLVLAKTSVQDVRPADSPNPSQTHTTALTVGESLERLKACAVVLGDKTKKICSQMPTYNWAIILTVAVVSIVAGVVLRRFASALACAALGTALVFAGMILLLMYKGTAPINAISRKPPFYGTLFVAMAASGTIEQLILCKRKKAKSKKTKKQNENGEKAKAARQNWRTS